uniref:Uncharacterized protein n=1 Tax=Anguilla anguilla TaxID=7936 RepID=A0A0E9U609_ANGAN
MNSILRLDRKYVHTLDLCICILLPAYNCCILDG